MKSVIFLDIDGVLNSEKWKMNHKKEINNKQLIDIEAVKIFSEIVKVSEADVILHSGWKFWFDESLNPINTEAKYLTELLHQENITISGMTPDLTTEEIRKTKKFSLVKADEILLWLKQNPVYTK